MNLENEIQMREKDKEREELHGITVKDVPVAKVERGITAWPFMYTNN